MGAKEKGERPATPPAGDEAFCDRCQKLVPVKDAERKLTNTGKVYIAARCSVCGASTTHIPRPDRK